MGKYILTIAMSVVSLSMMAASLTSGLVAHWPFDGNILDISGNGYNLSGNVSYTADRNGNEGAAAYFGGSTTLTPPRGLHVANSMTFSVWCKPSGNVPSGKRETLSGTDGATMPVSQYVLYPSHGGEDSTGRAGVGLLVGQNGVIVIEHADSYCPLPFVWYGSIGNDWTLVTITISANNAPTFYVNGVRIKSGLASSKKKFIGESDWEYPTKPGCYWGTVIGNGVTVISNSCGYNGLMDDFRIYNRALSDAEVNALYLQDMSASFYSVSFNANGGTGTIEEQVFEDSKKQKLSKNIFRKDGYVFQGWAKDSAERAELAAAGVIDVDYTDEQEITVDHDMTLYAVWANPPLTLTAESADWSSGSITLRCEDADKSGAEHSYTLEYYNENGTWVAVDDAQVSVAKGQNANNEEVWVARLTDSAFSSRLGGILPVQYHVKEVKCGRVSEPCVTRNRHAIFVGLNEWQDTDLESTGGDSDANNFFNIAALRGGFSNSENIHVLLNRGAKVDDVDDAFDRVAESVQTGDIFLFYFRTHGGYDKSDGTTSLRLYDKGYTDTALATKIQGIEVTGKSVAIIGIVAACHAGGMYDPDARLEHWYVANGLARCSANIAWIAAADREHTSYAVFNKFLLDYGWEEGWAGNDTRLSFLDLATYTKDRYEALLSGIKSYQGWEVQIENPSLLRNVMAGTRGSHKDKLPPAAVTGIKSETGDRVDEIKTEWNVVDNADGYWLFCETGGVNEVCAAYFCPAGKTEVIMSFQKLFGGSDFAPSKLPIKYSVKAVNGAGVSVASTVEVQNFARIVFDANGGGISGWRGALPREGIVYADITIGSILGGRLLTLPDAYGEGNKEFTGWFSVNGVQANPMAPIASDEMYLAKWKAKNTNGMTQDWLDSHQTIASASNGDIATAAAMTAANGCRTVGECYALGINPEDPNDDFRITAFRKEDGQPVITVNHTTDGSGNSFADRMRTLGKKSLTDPEWVDVTDMDQSEYRFFKVTVELDNGGEGGNGGR